MSTLFKAEKLILNALEELLPADKLKAMGGYVSGRPVFNEEHFGYVTITFGFSPASLEKYNAERSTAQQEQSADPDPDRKETV
ncbi:hypothetical protein FACS1894164_19280 [Spirochaetia bacterium]|nr:hypothetical protein FACS1894164_19280 [Spirochaetia bacterium]